MQFVIRLHPIMNSKLYKKLVFCILLSLGEFAKAELCNPDQQFCANDHHHSSSSSSSHPTSSSSLNFNPSTVPVSRGIGLETIYYKSLDFALVTGTGRIGAAISPANNDETFFGAPGFESTQDYLNRNINQTKYPTQKYTFATAFNIYENEESGLRKMALNVGVLGKYNSISESISPGGGISGLLGPFSFSYAIFQDESNVDLNNSIPGAKVRMLYQIQTYSVGLSLGSLSLDYSVLNLSLTDTQLTGVYNSSLTDADPAIVSLLTATLLYQRAIITLAGRQENSNRPVYNSDSKTLSSQQIENQVFASTQFILGPHFFIGAFYNYYLLREFSAGLTLFF